jgi:hypothetical protein
MFCCASEECVVLGGTQQEGNWNTEPDPTDSIAIYHGCCKLMPGLKVRDFTITLHNSNTLR